MSSFGERLRRGFKAAASVWGPRRFTIQDKVVICPHCGHDEFAEGDAQLNTSGMTFLGLDWANKSAYTLMCSECGRIEWFGQRPERVGRSSD